MSYTVPVIPISREETDRRLENVVNRIQRHCRIGKVTPKTSMFDSLTMKALTRSAVDHKVWLG